MANAQGNSEELPRAWQRAFSRMRGKAGDYLNDPEKARKLVEQAQAKAAHRGARSGPLAGVSATLQTMGRLVRAYARREYRRLPWGAILSIGAALLYFVAPLDALPDFVLGFGLIDDAAVLAFIATRLGEELAAFETWERNRSAARVGEAARDAVDAPAAADDLAPGGEPLQAATDATEELSGDLPESLSEVLPEPSEERPGQSQAE